MGRALWTSLAVGLVVVLGGWLWYWDAFERSPVDGKSLPARPTVVSDRAGELARILEEAPWVSPGNRGRALYKISFRECSDCLAYNRSEFDALHAAGVDTRVILYAPYAGEYAAKPEEEAVLADLYALSDTDPQEAWALYSRYYEPNAADAYYAEFGETHAPVEGDLERTAAVDRGRDVHDAVGEIMHGVGWDMERPAFFWQGPDQRWRVFMGDTPRGRRMIRNALGVPQG